MMLNKLQKKCFLASAGMHVLLFLVLLVGPAFLIHSEKADDMPVLEFIPDILVDQQVQGGGNPQVKHPPARHEVRKPEPQPVRKPEPQPVKKQTITKTPEPKPTPPKYTKAGDIKISDRMIKRNDSKPAQVKVASANPDASKAFNDAARSIRSATTSTSIEMPSLGAGSGPAYANYAQAVKSLYEKSWFPPAETSRDDALVKVQVVIAKDGSVVSAKIISRCGDNAIDGSVDATLRRVTSVPAFPAGAKESTRTYIIGFNLKAKRALG